MFLARRRFNNPGLGRLVGGYDRRRMEVAIAPAAGATTSHSPIVATKEVPYPNGLMPTSSWRIPAKIMSSQAEKKKNPPAPLRAKKERIPTPLSGRIPG